MLGAIGNKTVDENATLQFIVSATDPDGASPAMSATNVPSGASFVDNGNGTGTFTWVTDYVDAGVYANVTFKAQDNDSSPLNDTEPITIAVYNVNRAPKLAPIGNQSVDEGQILQVNVSATDADGTVPALGASNLPQGATFTDHHDGTGTFVWETDFFDAGTYPGVTIVAADAEDPNVKDQKTFPATVTNVNRTPVIDPVNDVAANEGDTISFLVTASDPDQTVPALSAVNVPPGASFADHGDGTATFAWHVDYTASAGSPFSVQFTAADGGKSAATSCSIAIANVNRPVTLETIGGKNAVEGQLISFAVIGSDPDTTPAVTATGLPQGAQFIEGAIGARAFYWTPDYHAAANSPYQVTFTVTDGEFFQSETVEIAVADAVAPGTITVTKPFAGSSLARTGPKKTKIKWESTGAVGDKVSVELRRNGELVAKIKGGTNNDGAFGWDIPAKMPAGGGYVVRVISKSNPLIYGDSGPFTMLS